MKKNVELEISLIKGLFLLREGQELDMEGLRDCMESVIFLGGDYEKEYERVFGEEYKKDAELFYK